MDSRVAGAVRAGDALLIKVCCRKSCEIERNGLYGGGGESGPIRRSIHPTMHHRRYPEWGEGQMNRSRVAK